MMAKRPIRKLTQRMWPIVAVIDVRRSASWYEQLLGASQSDEQSTIFEQILSADGEVLLCLHSQDPAGPFSKQLKFVLDPRAERGTSSGSLLWFVLDDFDDAWQRALALGTEVLESPNTHNGSELRAFVVRDPDGYAVAVNDGRVGRAR
jgi:predicted enzyme related to lactoylglutathione lyase